MSIIVDGKPQKISSQPPSYVTIDREWHDGDRIEIQVPMKLHAEPLPGATNIVALLYGRLCCGQTRHERPAQSLRNKSDGICPPARPGGASFCRQPGYFAQHVKATGQPLAFRTENLGNPRM